MNSTISTLREATAGVWRNSVPLVQLLGLCPLLAVTTSLVQGLALGVATTVVLVISNTLVALMRGVLVQRARVPVYILISAAVVTCIDLLTNAVFDELHERLALFIPLIVVNSALSAQAETVASRRTADFALVSGLATGFGFLAVLMTLGAFRELLGRGTLFADLALIGGESASWITVELPFDGMLVALLPPGAFFGLALLLALRNRLAGRPGESSNRASDATPEEPP